MESNVSQSRSAKKKSIKVRLKIKYQTLIKKIKSRFDDLDHIFNRDQDPG